MPVDDGKNVPGALEDCEVQLSNALFASILLLNTTTEADGIPAFTGAFDFRPDEAPATFVKPPMLGNSLANRGEEILSAQTGTAAIRTVPQSSKAGLSFIQFLPVLHGLHFITPNSKHSKKECLFGFAHAIHSLAQATKTRDSRRHFLNSLTEIHFH
jgi:hypothetical protein